MLGSGQFGSVHRAIWYKGEKEEVEVAVKSLTACATKDDVVKFLQEAVIMAQFKNANVLRMFGVVTGNQTEVIG